MEVFPFEYSVLLEEPPGIAGLASLIYRNEEEMFQARLHREAIPGADSSGKLRLALKYRSRRTFISDLEIICRTVLGLKSPATD